MSKAIVDITGEKDTHKWKWKKAQHRMKWLMDNGLAMTEYEKHKKI